VPRSTGGRSKALPVAGLPGQVFPAAEFLPAAGLADLDAAAAGLPAREGEEGEEGEAADAERAPAAAGLPAHVFAAAGLPAHVFEAAGLRLPVVAAAAARPPAGLAPAARAGRRSGDSGIETCTFREMHEDLRNTAGPQKQSRTSETH
jgi:hypothetical protein